MLLADNIPSVHNNIIIIHLDQFELTWKNLRHKTKLVQKICVLTLPSQTMKIFCVKSEKIVPCRSVIEVETNKPNLTPTSYIISCTMASTAPSRPKPTHQDTAHDIYAEFHTPPPPAAAKFQLSLQEDEASNNSFDMFRNVMKTGVLYATSRAQKHGFKRLDDPEWANSYVSYMCIYIYICVCFYYF